MPADLLIGPGSVAAGEPECPKHMVYGPCGGVDFDGGCEIGDRHCVFVDLPTIGWAGAAPVAGEDGIGRVRRQHGVATVGGLGALARSSRATDLVRETLAVRPLVVADFPARALDVASIAACAAPLVGRVDAVLCGDSGRSRVQFPPAHRARLVAGHGLAVWTGLNCRDRNRVALEGELAALAEVGVAGVHCVTGDHPAVGDRADAAAVFDLDSTRLAAMASEAGHLVSVAEAPIAPPTGRRPARLLEKEKAGAEVCFVNHAGGVRPVAEFVAAARALGARSTFIACVPVVTDAESAQLLRTFTTLALPPGFLAGILSARDPYEAGLAAAVALARELLAVEGVSGINLSGGPGRGREVEFAAALGEISDRLIDPYSD